MIRSDNGEYFRGLITSCLCKYLHSDCVGEKKTTRKNDTEKNAAQEITLSLLIIQTSNTIKQSFFLLIITWMAFGSPKNLLTPSLMQASMATYKHVHIRLDFLPWLRLESHIPEEKHKSPSFCSHPFTKKKKNHKKVLVLTYLVVHLKCNVELQDDQHKLEPGAHLFVRQRNVDSKHYVVGLNLLGHGLIEGPDLVALVRTPGHEPFCFLSVLDCVHTLGGQIVDRCSGAGSWWDKCNVGEMLDWVSYWNTAAKCFKFLPSQFPLKVINHIKSLSKNQ